MQIEVPKFESLVTGELIMNDDETITRECQFIPGTPYDDLAWWAGQLLGAEHGDSLRGLYRKRNDNSGVYVLDENTVEFKKPRGRKWKAISQ